MFAQNRGQNYDAIIPMLMVVLGLMAGTLHCQVMQWGWAVRGGVSADSSSEISSSSQGFDTSQPAAFAGVAVFMDTSAIGHFSGLIAAASIGLMGTSALFGGRSGLVGASPVLRRRGLRKASRSGSAGTSGLPMFSQSGFRAPSGLMGTSQAGGGARSGLAGWRRSSMMVKGSRWVLADLSDRGGASGLV